MRAPKNPDGEPSFPALIVGVFLLTTGVIAIPVGIVFMFLGTVLFGLLATAYGVGAVLVAVYGVSPEVMRVAVRPLLTSSFAKKDRDRARLGRLRH